MEIVVLRLGHRALRDKRVTSHVCLVARAFGANEVIISGDEDRTIEDTMKKITDKWGGTFKVSYTSDPIKTVVEWKNRGGEVIHLTMYGVNLPEVLEKIKSSRKPKMIVVGAEKVPKEVYEIADYNVAIGNQPHSEVAALAIILDRLLNGLWSRIKFDGAKLVIVPSERGKKVKYIRQ
ncbi:MAG: tRNA (cytidine(56)-2'-O)-methyltransferase [Candidatus Methanomethylicota archaeon]|uniref:tRNA (cytidine(56)-2'-O)-methyltransferase n=1 Tax=Thermoproteota archaeon TaxID=2056631 RepID=A0A497ETH5_9CREN|nr:MAG: tRNA (cytidine(56)-2'-O)-methyltransferase [Candidatus Verstraetearchaeota archaeon]